MVNPPSPLHCSCAAKVVNVKAKAEEEADGELEEVQSDWVNFESVFEDYHCSPPLTI